MKDDKQSFWQSLKLAYELGYTIAIPIVFFGLLGRYVDKTYKTSPVFLLVGIFASLLVSSIAIYFKAVKILKQIDNIEIKKNTDKENKV